MAISREVQGIICQSLATLEARDLKASGLGELGSSPQAIPSEARIKVGNPFRKLMIVKLELRWKVPLCWVSFVGLEGAIQTVRGETSPMILPNCKLCEPQHQPARHDITTVAIKA